MIQRRDTKQRQLVLDAVRERHDHPTADDIYLTVREKDSRISRGTVYRNLSLLSDEDEIAHIKVPGADRYDLRTDHHYHMICIKCSKVIDVPIPYNSEIDDVVGSETGYSVKHHSLIFEGICPECQDENDNGNENDNDN